MSIGEGVPVRKKRRPYTGLYGEKGIFVQSPTQEGAPADGKSGSKTPERESSKLEARYNKMHHKQYRQAMLSACSRSIIISHSLVERLAQAVV